MPTNLGDTAELSDLLTWVAWCYSYRLSPAERKVILPLFQERLAMGDDNASAFKASMEAAKEELSKQ